MPAFVEPSSLESIAPAKRALALENDSSSDGVQEFPSKYSTVYVGTGGDLSVFPTRSSVAVTYRNLPSGSRLSVLCKAIDWSETTASDLIVEW